MPKRNPNMSKLKPNYLFPEIKLRRLQFMANHPGARLISLGVGDTTEPIPEHITHSLVDAASQLGTRQGYTGYGNEQGMDELRSLISSKLYHDRVKPHEIFISDGAKCDIGRLQLLFGNQARIAVQDPSYPVYVDGSIMQGVSSLDFLPCLPQNQFFPDLAAARHADIIYFCSPNNPTGAVATKAQLQELVLFAKANGSFIVFDSAYFAYIQDPELPRSIFEIEGAKEVALETCSFSKFAGFTGVRLGWTVVPEELRFEDGSSVHKDWYRITSTIFNGASNIAQHGGLGVLHDQGLKEVKQMIGFYMENASIIRNALRDRGYEVYGGTQAPYLWVQFPGRTSWDVFQEFLEQMHIVTIPGSGFGHNGESFLRLTSFGSRKNILAAADRIRTFSFMESSSV